MAKSVKNPVAVIVKPWHWATGITWAAALLGKSGGTSVSGPSDRYGQSHSLAKFVGGLGDVTAVEPPAYFNNSARYKHRRALASAEGMVPDMAPRSPAAAPQGATQQSNPSFLSVVSKDDVPLLGLNGQAVPLLGFNMPLPEASLCGVPSTNFTSLLTEMTSHGNFNAIRLWFLQSAGGPGNWDNFDSAIAQAKSHGLKIVAPLANMWGVCEPGTVPKNLTWFQDGYKSPDANYTLSYRDYASAVFKRYAQEETIGIWQLVNEPDARSDITGYCPSENAAFDALQGFATDMQTVFQNSGAKQLLSMGIQGASNCGTSGEHWANLQKKFPVCTFNRYSLSYDRLGDRLTSCASNGLPSLIGETGMCSTVANVPNATSAAATAQSSLNVETTCTDVENLSLRADKLVDVARAGIQLGSSGVLVWHLMPSKTDDTTFSIFPGDPLLEKFGNFTQTMLP